MPDEPRESPDTERATEGPGGPATNPAAASPPAEPAPPTEEWATRYKYLLADFENYRRRTEREREAISRQSRGALLRELLPILEAFRSAQEAIGRLPADDGVRRGLELLDREWKTFLKHEGVEAVAVVGQPFRADEAEAVAEAPAADRCPDGCVSEIVQQGYRFYGGLLRPAKVVVARTSSVPTRPEEAPTEERSG